MTAAPIARLSEGGRLWALGALFGDDQALATLAPALLDRWRRGDHFVVLGNMLGDRGDPCRTLDLLLRLRRRLMAANLGCSVVFLRGAQEEMWHKLLALQFALEPLSVLDWMLARGLAAVVEGYGASIADGRFACRHGPSAIVRWTVEVREQQSRHPGHPELLNGLKRAALDATGGILMAAAGIDPRRPLDEQADSFWWSGQSDAALATALARGGDAGWDRLARLVRGAGSAPDEADDDGRVLTVTRQRPALVALDAAGRLIDRIEA
ncbi:hypothetical protein [Reyranella sp.]|uniref:hypothetical protein n=1 Tax=Reyranella sp. TaxID=1929291 RepID=UPI003BAC6098